MNKFITNRCLNGGNSNVLPASAFLNLVSYFRYKEEDSIFTCRFNPDWRFSNIFAFGKENGEICCGDTCLAKCEAKNLGAIETTSSLIRREFQVDDNAVTDCQWQPSRSSHLYVASGNGSIFLWDLEERKLLSSFCGHALSVKCLSVCSDEPHLFASGSRDGSILLYDIRSSDTDDGRIKPVRTIRNAHAIQDRAKPTKRRKNVSKPGQGAVPVTALLLHDKQTIVSGSSKKSGIRFWDMRKIYSTKSLSPPVPARSFAAVEGKKEGAGFTSFSTDPYGRHTLYAACTDNLIYAYSLTSSSVHPIRRYEGAHISFFDEITAICPTSPYLLCGSQDGTALIWSLDSEQPKFVLDGHLERIYAVAWNDRFELLTFSDDCWRLWRTQSLENSCDYSTQSLNRCRLYDPDPYEFRFKRRRFEDNFFV